MISKSHHYAEFFVSVTPRYAENGINLKYMYTFFNLVQGSGIGPSSYIVGASDLHPIHTFNIQVKYADDSYLLIGSSHLSTATEEFAHITNWAEANNLRLNATKTREMVIYKKRQAKRGPVPEVIPGAERVESMKILGVTLQSNLGMTTHIDKILATSSSSLYALRVLRSHGLQPAALHNITMATTVAHII